MEEPRSESTPTRSVPDDLATRTDDMMNKVRAALDRIAAESQDEDSATDRPSTVWAGRTRGTARPVNFATTTPPESTPVSRAFPAMMAFRSKEEQEDYALLLFGMRRCQIKKA